MRIAVDTNVISALWSRDPAASFAHSKLEQVRPGNGFLVCAPVYAELMAHPEVSEVSLQNFLHHSGVVADFELPDEIWREAGRRFSRYAARRRRSGGGHPRRMLVDFIIGAHALAKTDGLLTLDSERYRRDFPELQLL